MRMRARFIFSNSNKISAIVKNSPTSTKFSIRGKFGAGNSNMDFVFQNSALHGVKLKMAGNNPQIEKFSDVNKILYMGQV